MKMIRAVIRQERVDAVTKALLGIGMPGMTRFSVFGRGKQRGLRIGEVTYDELPKEMLMIVVDDQDVARTVDCIIDAARSGSRGAFGDGKIFVSPVLESYTISSKSRDAKEEEAVA
jgi:nitrogen regulatory protein PII 1